MNQPINEVKPFKALHYNSVKVGDIGLCLSQPYDVISEVEQDAYYAQHPNNVIRLILNKIEKKDDEKNNRYTRADGFLKTWKKEGVLQSSEHPWFFVYEQNFSLPGVGEKKMKGFIGLVRLADYEEGKILPHEQVQKRPVEDRIRLTTTTSTQFEYIWGLYKDEGFVIDRILDESEAGAPLVDYYEPRMGVRHRLYRLKDPAECSRIQETMSRKIIYIADGHHRYQTMLNIRDEMRKKYPDAGTNAPWEYIMMFLVNVSHEGLVILPTHRLLYNLEKAALDRLVSEIGTFFKTTRFAFEKADEKNVRARWLAALEKTGQSAFGIATKDLSEYLMIELKDTELYLKLIKEKATDTYMLLDVNIFNILILQKILGITDEMLSLQKGIEYSKDADDAVNRVRQGEMQIAFILKATPLEAVLKVSEATEKMPRKSTFFYPKPLSGLVFYEMGVR